MSIHGRLLINFTTKHRLQEVYENGERLENLDRAREDEPLGKEREMGKEIQRRLLRV